jgi:ribose 5-phosphate isomerase A
LKSADNNSALKRRVGYAAAERVGDGMTVGIGTGSTVAFFIEALGERIRQGLSIRATTTSYQSALLCDKAGIPLIPLRKLDRLDLALDGADAIDPDLNAIKGGGAAHTVEKIVAAMAERYLLIADESKLCDFLGQTFPIPVEIIPDSLAYVVRRIRALGGEPVLRIGQGKDGPVVTDNGQFVLDIQLSDKIDVFAYDAELHRIPGVVETGFFLGLADEVLVGRDGRVDVMTK